MKKISAIILAAVAVLAAGAAAYFFFSRGGSKEGAESSPEPTPELYTYEIKDSFITNIKDSASLFKTSIVLVVNKKDMAEYFDERLYTIRDTVLFMLRDLTEEDILSLDIQDRLRVKIPEELNRVLGIDNIVSVYFNDFVMQ